MTLAGNISLRVLVMCLNQVSLLCLILSTTYWYVLAVDAVGLRHC